MSPSEILRVYVFFHNHGVEMADFESLLSLFAPDAFLNFQNPGIGIFNGLESIREIFRRKLPEFMIGFGEITETPRAASTDYYDRKNPTVRLGSIGLETNGETITRISIGG